MNHNLVRTIEAEARAEVYKQLFEQGRTIKEIAEATGASPVTIGRWLYDFFKCAKKDSQWTEDRDRTLTEMWKAQATASQIGEKLGVSRNAVLGRRFRLGLESHREAPRAPRMRKPSMSAIPAEKLTVAPSTEPVGPYIPIMDLGEHHCRAPMGWGADGHMTYCGQQRLAAIRGSSVFYLSSYCRWHHVRFHQRSA